MTKRILPTPEQLRELLTYDTETGKLYWKRRAPEMFPLGARSQQAICNAWNSKHADREAFTANHNKGYLVGRIGGICLLAHRVALTIYHDAWPSDQVDHVNGNRRDNRICNLRQATPSGNSANSKIRLDNKSGFKGVYLHAQNGNWVAELRHKNKKHYLGVFSSPEEAHAAYCDAAVKIHKDFARFG